jgi:hypothetical protein
MIYEIELPDGRIIEVEGEPGQEEKAIQTVREYIAKEGTAQIIEEEDFDYKTGIQSSFLRGQLDMADNMEEKEGVLQRYAGSDGFIRDTRGNLAITPLGQRRLSSKGMLDKDKISNKNIVIDEEGFSFADFADFGGTLGPLAGAIAALSPHGRLLKTLQPFLKSDRITRSAAAAIGSGGGQLGEEAIETVRGLQKQTIGEVGGEALIEAGIGGIGQGLFEGGGAALHALLGRKGAIADIDISRAIAQGADPAEVELLKNRLGRMPTFDDILKAQDDGTISSFTEAAVSQRALGRSIPGRIQAASETVFGRTERDKKLIQYGNERLKKFLENLNDETLDLQAVGNAFKTGQLTKGQVDDLIKEMSDGAAKTNKDVQEYVKNAIQQIDDGAFTLRPDRIGIGQKIRDDLKNIYDDQFGIVLDDAGNEIAAGTFVQRSRGIDSFLVAKDLDAVYGGVDIDLSALAKELDNLVKKQPGLGLQSAVEQVPSNPIVALQKILKDSQGKMSIEALNNLRSSILAVKRASGAGVKDIGVALNKVEREIADIFKKMEDGNSFLKIRGPINKEDAATNISKAAKMIRSYNSDYQKAIKPFNDVVVSKIRKEAASNAFDVDQIYTQVIRKDYPTALNKVLNALDNPTRVEVKSELQKNVLREALANSVDDLGNVNPVSFAKFINDKLGSTKDVLFDNIPDLKIILSDFGKINTRLDAKRFSEIVERLEMPEFRNVVTKLVDAENAKHLVETDKLLSRIQSADPEEIVSTLFRNGQASNIARIKEIVDADTFQKIQQDSMRDLLNLAVGPGKRVDEVFNPEALERALNAKGDAVLDEMFGKESIKGLRNLVRDLRVMTSAEGGGAGTLIAGAVAVNAFNVAMLPTLVQLGVMGSVMRNPAVVRRLAKADKESVSIVMQAFRDALRLFPAISIGQSVVEGSEALGSIVEEAIDEANLGDITEELSTQIQTQQPPKLTTQLDLPEISPVPAQSSGIMSPSLLGDSDANLDIAQRISNIA